MDGQTERQKLSPSAFLRKGERQKKKSLIKNNHSPYKIKLYFVTMLQQVLQRTFFKTYTAMRAITHVKMSHNYAIDERQVKRHHLPGKVINVKLGIID